MIKMTPSVKTPSQTYCQPDMFNNSSIEHKYTTLQKNGVLLGDIDPKYQHGGITVPESDSVSNNLCTVPTICHNIANGFAGT